MFLFLHKYGVEMSRAESPVSSYTCADLAAPNWRRRIGGAELSHSGLECRTPSTVQSVADTGQSCVQSRDNSRTIGHGELSSCAIHTLNTCNLTSNAAQCCVRLKEKVKLASWKSRTTQFVLT